MYAVEQEAHRYVDNDAHHQNDWDKQHAEYDPSDNDGVHAPGLLALVGGLFVVDHAIHSRVRRRPIRCAAI
jgi:hypothetical protein